MKKIFITLLILLVNITLFGQNNLGKSDDSQRIAIKPYYLESKFKSKDGNLLLSKMNKLLTKEGLSSNYSRYIMWPRVDVLSQEATETAPTMYITELDVTFYIADNIDQTIYNQVSFTTKGVDKKADKSYYKALKKVKSTNSDGINFLNDAKSKIIEYYNSKCDFILNESKTLASMKEFDKAIYNAVSIPDVCKDCYIKGQELAVKFYMQKLENECMQMISKAKAEKIKDNHILAAEILGNILPDVSCYDEAQILLKEIQDNKCAVALGKARGAWSAGNADEAGKWIGQIPANSNCSKDTESLIAEIKTKLKQDEDRDWDFKMQVYNDNVEIKKATIKAVRDVGVAYGENQQPTNINWISRY